MPRYKVTVSHTTYEIFEVEAPTSEEGGVLVMEGEVRICRF